MTCERCNKLSDLIRIVDTLHGKDFHAEQCDCEEDRKVLIHDVCEAPPKSGYCSKEGTESPE